MHSYAAGIVLPVLSPVFLEQIHIPLSKCLNFSGRDSSHLPVIIFNFEGNVPAYAQRTQL
jgi:hypothetical protein